MRSITEQLTSRVVNEIITEAEYEGEPMGRPEEDVPSQYGRYSQPTNTPEPYPEYVPTGRYSFTGPMDRRPIIDFLLRHPDVPKELYPSYFLPARTSEPRPGVTPIGR